MGCGSGETRVEVHPVSGSVIVDGKPTANIRLTFFPRSVTAQEGHVYPKTVTALDGTFELTTYEPADGIPAGDYVVTASWKENDTSDASEMHPDELSLVEEKLDAKFTTPDLSPINVTIEQGENRLPPFELSLAEPKSRKKKRK